MPKVKIYDTIIIGTGPAGFTAAIYAVRREMKALLIGKENGGQLIWASEIENYPGFRRIMSYELIAKWQHHALDLGAELVNAEVQQVEKKGEIFIVTTGQESYQAQTLIIAMGLVPRRLAIPGEEKFTGRGISYCANCDSPFYRNKQVVVVGGGNSAFDAAEILSKIASQVYLVHRSEKFRAFEALVAEVKAKKNVKLFLNSSLKEIKGRDKVEEVVVAGNEGRVEERLAVEGVFIEIGRIAHTDLVAELVDRTKHNQIIVDDKGRTRTPGLFAAGDVTTVDRKSVV